MRRTRERREGHMPNKVDIERIQQPYRASPVRFGGRRATPREDDMGYTREVPDVYRAPAPKVEEPADTRTLREKAAEASLAGQKRRRMETAALVREWADATLPEAILARANDGHFNVEVNIPLDLQRLPFPDVVDALTSWAMAPSRQFGCTVSNSAVYVTLDWGPKPAAAKGASGVAPKDSLAGKWARLFVAPNDYGYAGLLAIAGVMGVIWGAVTIWRALVLDGWLR